MGHCSTCNAQGPVMVYVSKLFPKPDASAFDAFGRVFSGTVKPGDRVRVLGEAYSPEDEEDSAVAQVKDVWVFMGRYRIPVTSAPAGALLTHRSSSKRLTTCAYSLGLESFSVRDVGLVPCSQPYNAFVMVLLRYS